ncbi:MAG TPA: PAS domain S-box protein [Vicinamibacterales bacterium]|nr:PAS domain S-box protein [Vicinamibacterales bacterium]
MIVGPRPPDPFHDAVRHATRLQALLAHTSDGLVLLDASLQVIYASPMTTRMLGVRLEEVLGQPADAFVHPDDREKVRARLAEVLATAGGRSCATFRVVTADGSYRWIEAQATNHLDDPELNAIVGKYSDLTESRNAEHVLRQTRDELGRLSSAIEQTADSVMVTNRQGVIEYVNPAFEQMTGYTREETVGRTPRILNSGRQSQKFYETLWTAILAGRVYRTMTVNRRKDGTLYDEDQTITPIRDDAGAITHFISTGRDVTQRRRTQEALRRLNTQFEHEATRIAGILHDEAGQFLTAAHLQLAELAEQVTSDALEKIQDVKKTLNQVEEQLRRLSHEIHPRVVEDLGLVEAATFLADAFARRTGIAVTVHANLDRRYSIAVETLLYRLVQEGLTNMSRHSRATEGSVTVSHAEAELSCVVQDNGVGFEPGDSAGGGRVNLGLRLMRDRLEAVGGTLTIRSAPGHGTVLMARIPLDSEE